MTVNIIEESQYPPIITPLDIEILSYQDDFPGSIVGKIKASDQDPYDVLGYELLPSFSTINLPPTLHLFEVKRKHYSTFLFLNNLKEISKNDIPVGKHISQQTAAVSL